MKYGNDYNVGDIFDLGSYVITAEEIIEFAKKYDPQPYHLSEEAGKASFFGGLAASGWNTAAIWMGLYVRKMLTNACVQGSPGVDELRWYAPVKAGDHLLGTVEVISLIPHPFKSNLITVKKKGALRREHDIKPLMTLVLHSRFLKRPIN